MSAVSAERQEFIKQVLELWNDRNLTSSDIGRRVGISRSAVLGIVARARKKDPTIPNREEAGRFKKKPRKAGEHKPRKSPAAVVPLVLALEKPVETVPELGGRFLLDLQGEDCRWAVGFVNGQHVFCAKPRADKMYCEDHHQEAYKPVPQRVRA